MGNIEVQYCGVETSVGVGTAQYVGIIRIILTDGAGESNAYDISGAIYDTDSPLNIIGIPYLSDFFGKNDSIPNSYDDGTKITSSAKKSHFTWYHGKHEINFINSVIILPELTLETGF